ncbi:phage tail tape measure protein [Pontibacterium sp.]|uniref:phage tail tape measure protein n=1 Tax=Pontibacterium sp. TaxID=2036026 RepID=UPI003569DC3A
MAENKMRLSLIMGMVDKITAPVKKVTDGTAKMTGQVKKTQEQLKRLGNTTDDIEHFRKLKRSAGATETALEEAQQQVNRIAREMDKAGGSTRKLNREFEQAKRKVTGLKNAQGKEQQQLRELRQRLDQAGVSTRKLQEGTRRIKAETEQYTRQLKAQETALDGVAKRQADLNRITERNRNMRMDATVDAAGVAAGVYAVKQLTDAYGDVASAQGEIQSLGIDADGVATITRQARAFSNEWAGTAQEDFIKASYDIKSGISSLSNDAVGEFTRIAALTATGTKSQVDTMTSLFASGYGIYRKQFDQFGAQTIEGWDSLSQQERDMKFGEYFSAGISSSVQAFKTDGSQMSQAISTLGATATSANVSFAEQLSILGQLQATMSGSESATKFKAFLRGVTKAGDELGLSFVDSENNIRSIPEILDELKAKYGETLDAVESAELQGLFGDEGLAFITQLYDKNEDLKESISGMEGSLGGGLATTQKMAEAIGKGGPAEAMQLLNQRVFNLAVSLGALFSPAIIAVSDLLGGAANVVAKFTEEFPMLSQVIAFAIVGLIGLKAASVAGRFAFSYFSDTVSTVRKVIDFMTAANLRSSAAMALQRARAIAATSAMVAMATVTKTIAVAQGVLTAAQWALNAAMMANPIGLIILGVMALVGIVALLIKYWEPLGAFFSGLWDRVKGAFSRAWEFIKLILSFTPLGLLVKAWEPLSSFFGDMLGGITGMFGEAWDWISSSFLEPLQSLKASLGGLWDKLVGSSDVEVSQTVNSATEGAAVGASAVAGVVPAASVAPPASGSTVFQFGDIVIQPTPGMDAQEVAQLVDQKLRAWVRESQRQQRGLLHD